MKTRFIKTSLRNALWRATAFLALACVAFLPSVQAQTAGGTQIQNRASATYSDGTNSYSTVSNLVTVTVANVSGLAITPDAGSNSSVVPGQSGVDFFFTVTNASNYASNIRFLQNGASIAITGPATLQAAVVDANNNGLDGTDPDIKNNTGGDYLYGPVARNGSFTVIVRVNINAGAASGSTINVRLGDASSGGPTFDNQVADSSAAEVRTSVPGGTTAPVNGESEARGDISATVQNDAQLQASLTVPAGPVALGSNITYTVGVTNVGARDAASQTLQGAPAGSNTGVFIVVPIPDNTIFNSIGALPAGVTVLYSTSALGSDPVPGADPPASGPLSNAVSWQTAQPAAASIRRVAFRVGATLPAAGSGTNSVTGIPLVLTVQTGIDATFPIYGIAEAFARNSISAPITDQSDHPSSQVSGRGDGNANFNEPRYNTADPADNTKGLRLPTLLTQAGNVLIGPNGFPAAVGPTNNNDDYTNKSVAPAVVAGLGFGSSISSQGVVDFVNTVRNTGNSNDTFVITAPTVPAGFTVAVSTTGAPGSFTDITAAGSSISMAVNFGQDAQLFVRVTAPVGASVLVGYDTVIRARSTVTSTSTNDTIDRLYTGFLRLTKSVLVDNQTGRGAATDAVPGAQLEYSISYQNISSSGGTNCVTLTASNIVITEDGNAAPNNWGTTTTHVAGAASDSRGGTITGDTAGSTLLTDTVSTLAPGQSGTFKFRRTIN